MRVMRVCGTFYFTGGFMAQYDGAIRIGTKIDVKGFEDGAKNLKSESSRLSKDLEDLIEVQKAFLEAGGTKESKVYQDYEDKIKKIKSSLESLEKEQEKSASENKHWNLLRTNVEEYANSLKELQEQGKFFGDEEYDKVYLAWKNATDAVKEYQSELNKQSASGQAKIAEQEAKAAEKREAAQRRSEEQAEKALQKENARIQKQAENEAKIAAKEAERQAKIQAEAVEEQRLADIKANATVVDKNLIDLLERRKELLREIADLEKAGVTEGYAEYDKALADLSDVQEQINGIRDMRDAAAQARASYVGLGETVRQTFRTMARGLVDIPIAAVKAGVRGLISSFTKLGGVVKNVAVKSFHMLGNAIRTSLSRVSSLVGNVVSKMKLLGTTAKKSFSTVNKSAKKSNGIFSNFSSRLKGIISSLLIFNWITRAFNAVVKSIKDGFGNLYKDNEKFKASVDNLRASVLTLKNAFAAAFRPLVDVAIPYIQMAADKMTELLNKVSQFTSAITGQTTYTKAIKQTADAFKDAKKAAEGYLSPLDEINKFSSKKDEDEEQTGIMFEEVPIEQKFKDMAQKVKDVFKDLFAPIKEAWNREGEFVIDSWKYGLGEIKKLLKDIGRDFLKVWQQPETIKMLQDILHIFGDIGLIVGNLASKFREAWNENNVGLHILENIRDIFAVIISNIRSAADYTAEWTKTLDFTPFLQGIERLTASLVPFFDFLSGTLADFYTQFLLPFASWTLSEEGIPRLLNVLSDFMESVDWQGIGEALSSLYSALEPYAEAVGTGLIDFIERMKEYGVDFLNFLPGAIQNAADALRNGDLPVAFEEFGHICGEAIKLSFNIMRETINSIPWGNIGVWIGSFLNGIDWAGVSEAFFGRFVDLLNGIVEGIYNLIITTDWVSIGRQIGTSFSNALMEIDWAGLGRTLSESFKSFFTFIYEAIEAVDWYGLGQKVKELLVNIDWAGVTEALFRAIGSALGGLAAFIWGIIEEAWNQVVEWWHDVAYEDGHFTIEGLLNGILDAFSSIAEWIYEHIFEPFVEGFKNAFGIHSPSTVMMEMGTYIIQGLLDGINSLVSNVTETWQSMKETAVEIWNDVKQKLSETMENLRVTSKEKWESMKESARSNFESIKTKAGELENKFGSLKEKTRSVFDSMRDKISSASDSMKDKLSGFIDKVKDAINAVKDFLKSGYDKIKSGVQGAFGGGESSQSYSARSFSTRSMSMPYSVYPAIEKLNNMPIPGYATGQVIPRTMQKHLAWLGDNPRETEVVSPLSTIEEAVINAIGKIGAFGGNMGGTPVNLTLQVALDGQVIGQKMVDWGKLQQMATGVNPYDLGTT